MICTDQSPWFGTHVIRRLTVKFNHHRVKAYHFHPFCIAKVESRLAHRFLHLLSHTLKRTQREREREREREIERERERDRETERRERREREREKIERERDRDEISLSPSSLSRYLLEREREREGGAIQRMRFRQRLNGWIHTKFPFWQVFW